MIDLENMHIGATGLEMQTMQGTLLLHVTQNFSDTEQCFRVEIYPSFCQVLKLKRTKTPTLF